MKYPILEGSITRIKHHKFGFSEYQQITTFWSDGTQTKKEVLVKIHHIEPLRTS